MDTRILTKRGSYVDLLNLTHNIYMIDDIASSLSMQCRFTGHTQEFYSVAQHSVLVSYGVPEHLALDGLMHDAVEAYLGDVSSPLKQLLPEYKVLEDNMYASIAVQLGYNMVLPIEVKRADIIALVTEKRDLFRYDDEPEVWSWLDKYTPWDQKIEPVSQKEAYQMFMDRYKELTNERSA